MFSDRLKTARKMAGLSLPQLAIKLGDISKQSLSNYENGKRKPDSKILLKLAKALGVKPDFFFRENTVQMKSFEYRKNSRLGKKEREMIEEKTKDQLERYLELENILNISSKFENPLNDFKIKIIEDVEKAALYLREEWELGQNPIKNLIENLEERGIKIIQIAEKKEFDGLAGYSGNIPFIVINKNIEDVVRKRMTIAHELGHLLLKPSRELNKKEIEQYCFRFAGAFLIPREVMQNELGKKRKHITSNELIHLKNEYGISVQGLIRRAKDLRIISEARYTDFCIKIRKDGWEKYELGNYNGDEKPIREKNLIYRAITEEIISISKAASILNRSVADLQGEMHILL
ncbi:MAG: XRE family transcriptional regulator [Ignavibacteriaceae bacterium]|nr:XRE family transcriptional regulator [Ignavibacteriaceae bacterium]